MKKTIFALTIASLLSAPALASKEGFYIGADLASNSLDSDSFDTGIGLVAGYDFQVTPQIVIGVEGEYRNFGKDKVSIPNFLDAELKAHSFGINVKPKYYFNNNFYAGFQLGLHSVKEEEKGTWWDGDTYKESDSDTGLSYGVEAGYDFNRNVSIKGGYKAISVKPLGVDSDYGTFYIGANYKF
ncbi:porin family protein [Photobacterium minamisatsumaniensis]|uniref:porin family protein n=1 Tax=Photobacterium minamisatsumaniensis TaxID=2910233 RepID=UPI003D0F1FBA